MNERENINVREIREAMGLNPLELAAKLGVAESTVRRWEIGTAKIHEVNRRQLERLARKVRKLREAK